MTKQRTVPLNDLKKLTPQELDEVEMLVRDAWQQKKRREMPKLDKAILKAAKAIRIETGPLPPI